jgi:hypothetical protein
MKNSLFVCALLATGALASCFNPDLTGVVVTCDPPAGSCPSGQECNSQGVCVTPGTPGATDMATPSTLLPAEGCPQANGNTGLGFDVTAAGKPTVYACPAKFQNKAGQTADMQCRAPYVLCTNANNIDLAACQKAGQLMNGYFISDVVANRKFGGGSATCGPPGGGSYALWAGCGRSATAVSCQGFASALDCGFGAFTCQGSRIGDVSNSDGASGVLCCKQ